MFYFPLFLPVLDTCRRGGDALACVGHQESWPGLGLLGNCCSLPRRGGEGKMRGMQGMQGQGPEESEAAEPHLKNTEKSK